MNTGLWVWPPDDKAQRRVLRKVAGSEHLVDAMQALAKSKDGLSNAQVDDVLLDNSHWQTRWVLEQLIALGFVDYKVDFFGGPGKYTLTELGGDAFSAITGKLVQKQLQAAPSPAKPPAPPRTATQPQA